jgi:RimJ/RimL family protein N-acetyltransferase
MSTDSSLFGIFFEHTEFVGTVKIGNLNKIHKTADIGILIGRASHHGMGIGSGTIKAICESLNDGNLIRKLNAGVISTNLPSLRAFEKNGFLREGLRNKQFLGPNGNAEDEILFGKFL